MKCWPFNFGNKNTTPRTKHWIEYTYIALDLELTGLDPKRDEILSFGWVTIEQGKIHLQTIKHEFVNGPYDPSSNISIHGITHADLSKGRSLDSIMNELKRDLWNKPLILHHAALDFKFLMKAWLHCFNGQLTNPVFDTLTFEQKRFLRRHIESRHDDFQLTSCRQRYGLPNYTGHNAHTDALATAELFLSQAHAASQGKFLSQKDLFELS